MDRIGADLKQIGASTVSLSVSGLEGTTKMGKGEDRGKKRREERELLKTFQSLLATLGVLTGS